MTRHNPVGTGHPDGAACDRCLLPLRDGALRFRATLVLHGDTGPVLAPPADSGTEDALTRALRAAESMTEEELMADVAEEFRFVLCPACRAALRADPASAATVRAPRGTVPQ